MDGTELRIARIRVGLKQYEAAQQAGMRPNELSLIENGRASASPEQLARLSQVLGLGQSRGDHHGHAG
jgi:transcriptional regulator with XRE-family HTH domain